MGASPTGGVEGAGGVPEVPGVMPVDAGACAAGEVGAAVRSWEAVAALDTAVAMSVAATGTLRRPIDGMRGKTGVFESWWVSLGWLPCCWPAGVPDEVALGDLVLVLGEDGVPEGLVLPATRFERIGLAMCGLVVGVLVALGDSALDGVLARGISGSCCGVTSGAWPWLYAATCTAGL